MFGADVTSIHWKLATLTTAKIGVCKICSYFLSLVSTVLNTVKTRLAITRKNLQIERKQMNVGVEYCLNSTTRSAVWPSDHLHLIICLKKSKITSSSHGCHVGGGKADHVY